VLLTTNYSLITHLGFSGTEDIHFRLVHKMHAHRTQQLLADISMRYFHRLVYTTMGKHAYKQLLVNKNKLEYTLAQRTFINYEAMTKVII
jgi:hypothetical protein